MKILLINSVCGVTSTGRIVTEIYDCATANGLTAKIAYGECRHPNITDGYSTIKIGSKIGNYLHAIGTRITDRHGLFSRRATLSLIEEIKEYSPDVIHIHNLHGYYINYKILFDYLKNTDGIKVFWTLHDCWSLTGHCAYYSEYGCEKWKTGCSSCPLKKNYPASAICDNSKSNYLQKKASFTGVKNMTILVPSEWMKMQVKESFLKEYPTLVVNNGIDLDSFKLTTSDFKKSNQLDAKKIVLGVANVWSENKGLKYFLELAKLFEKNGNTDVLFLIIGRIPNMPTTIPQNMKILSHTNSKEELNQIYNISDIYISFSSEETFGMTVIEAMAAGAYPIVMKNTACEEIVSSSIGSICDRNLDTVYEHVVNLLSGKLSIPSREEISVSSQKYDKKNYTQEIVSLYMNN